MSIIFRYLNRQVLVSMLAVTGVLLMVFMSGRFLKYLSEAATGKYPGDILFMVMAYRFPGFLELILPLGLFIGILLAHGRMYLDSEMSVLFACGVSDRQVLGYTMVTSLVIMVLVGVISLYLAPWGMAKVDRIFDAQKQKTEFELLTPGRFQSLPGGDRVTYTESLSDNKRRLSGVFIAEHADDGSGPTLIAAEAGSQFVDEDTGSRFLVLEDGHRFAGKPGQPDYQVTSFDAYGLKVTGPESVRTYRDEEGIPTLELWRSDNPDHRALFHWRVSLPFLVPVVTLLAVPLSRVNPRQGRFFHLLPAMLIYIGYLGLLIVARDALARGDIPEWLGLAWVHVLFLGLGLWLQFGPGWMRRRRLQRECQRHA
ncbi:LPS export ABC transporter permease LptF [Tamilnaduibacter salinus]|uniref:Lipopolysaccharide export system permease protein LptF n=1 Tax=Tamilnaduibacter salinus TaxID=1484056 RepID=A0A2A2HZT8_9GAMM|nr:LPS export ABC transporter permease LptF [Tamilnaduibacter salinus]PAV24534.1 LPS export ABC transporter permease LptF [Tamilnaduibacter salinus]